MNKTISKSSRVFSNLLQQNCYVRDVTRTIDLKSPSSSDSEYLSLDEVVDDGGVKIVKNPVPYHITPEYVNSFADSADYRRDPVGAISNGVVRKNLTDCTDFQKILSMDSSAQLDLYNQLKAKFSKSKPVVSNNKTVVSNNQIVNNNGGDNNAK